MGETKRPNVTGKGPSLIREMLGIFGQINEDLDGLPADGANKVKTVLQEKGQTIEPLTKRPFMKTVKAGEMAWDCKEAALAVQNALKAGQADQALEHIDALGKELDELIHRIQTFVVRMT